MIEAAWPVKPLLMSALRRLKVPIMRIKCNQLEKAVFAFVIDRSILLTVMSYSGLDNSPLFKRFYLFLERGKGER